MNRDAFTLVMLVVITIFLGVKPLQAKFHKDYAYSIFTTQIYSRAIVGYTIGNSIDLLLNNIVDLSLVFTSYSREENASDSVIDKSSEENRTIPIDYTGTWEGKGIQNIPHSSWNISLVLTNGDVGSIAGVIVYPSLGCGGILTIQKVSDNSVELIEDITFGTNNCVDGGAVILSVVSQTELSYFWSKDDFPGTASGQLTRANSTSNVIPSIYSGIWSGQGIQTYPETQWTMLMGLHRGDIGSIVGVVAYPSLRCVGELKLVKSGLNSIELFEKITFGNCVDEGTITIDLESSDEVSFFWKAQDFPGTASGKLTRISNLFYGKSISTPIKNMEITQEFARYSAVVSDRYHTGIDVRDINAGSNYALQRKIPISVVESGIIHKIFGLKIEGNSYYVRNWNPLNDSYSWSTAPNIAGNRGLGITLIIYHPKVDRYTLYAHLDAVREGLTIGDTLDAGHEIGLIGNSYYNPDGSYDYLRYCRTDDGHDHQTYCINNLEVPPGMHVSDIVTIEPFGFSPHLHFEYKKNGTLGDFSDTAGEGFVGYTPYDPDERNYLDPMMSFHLTSSIAQTRVKVSYDGINIRSGPGDYSYWGVVNKDDEFFAIAEASSTTNPPCSMGWYQITNLDHQHFSVQGISGSIPRLWICKGNDGSNWVEPIITSAQILTQNTPIEYRLKQNYPNPFNPSTNIEFSLPEANHVTLKVYDMLGRHVTTLVDGYREAGLYIVTFEARDISSGVYLYRIEAGERSEVRKMMYVR